jgi:hypothetical protein
VAQVYLIYVSGSDVFLRLGDHAAECCGRQPGLEVDGRGRRGRLDFRRIPQVLQELPCFEPTLVGMPINQRILVNPEAKRTVVFDPSGGKPERHAEIRSFTRARREDELQPLKI